MSGVTASKMFRGLPSFMRHLEFCCVLQWVKNSKEGCRHLWGT